MALQDNSDDASARYGWLSAVSSVWAAADTTLESYSNVEVVTGTGETILRNPSGLQVGYTVEGKEYSDFVPAILAICTSPDLEDEHGWCPLPEEWSELKDS